MDFNANAPSTLGAEGALKSREGSGTGSRLPAPAVGPGYPLGDYEQVLLCPPLAAL